MATSAVPAAAAGWAALNGVWGLAGACTLTAIALPFLPTWRNRDASPADATGSEPPVTRHEPVTLVAVVRSLSPKDLSPASMPFLYELSRTAIHGSLANPAAPPTAVSHEGLPGGGSGPGGTTAEVPGLFAAASPHARSTARFVARARQDDSDVHAAVLGHLRAGAPAQFVFVTLDGLTRDAAPYRTAQDHAASRTQALRDVDGRLAAFHAGLTSSCGEWTLVVMGEVADGRQTQPTDTGLLVVCSNTRRRGRNVGARPAADVAATLLAVWGVAAPEPQAGANLVHIGAPMRGRVKTGRAASPPSCEPTSPSN